MQWQTLWASQHMLEGTEGNGRVSRKRKTRVATPFHQWNFFCLPQGTK